MNRAWCRLALIAVLWLATALAITAAVRAEEPPRAPAAAAKAPSALASIVGLVDLAVVAFLVHRRADVRLVLMLAALPMFMVVGKLPEMFDGIATEMANKLTVVPICSALGFAFVLRMTECDQHLVQLLLLPLRRVRALLIPGGIAAAYVVNSAIVSQTGTAAVLGPILIPLLRAAGISPVTSGALLLLGSSMGGELFNPGAVEMRTLARLTHQPGTALVARMTPLNLLACGAALVVFWILALRREQKSPRPLKDDADASTETSAPFRINPIKAAVPLLPLALLFVASAFFEQALPHAFSGPARILAAMLIGVVAAGLTSLRHVGELSTAFFEGAGYAYTHVISLIVAATVFADGIRETGLIRVLTLALAHWPPAVLLVAVALPWLLATVSGTGIAPAVAVMEFLIPEAARLGVDPIRLGTMTALGAHFGRTMSPVAAVVMMCSTLTETSPRELVPRVAPPLLVGGVVLFLAGLWGGT
ncbi:MAG TPA: C4-dicarboxylate transporter DcuC [Isosphaeraceae bacterium]|jgi:DcuC family C4-dicarboxylate transporter|nr:C4-dicarboxylate transporter DcuC [Isosphaeraceae bacterium]